MLGYSNLKELSSFIDYLNALQKLNLLGYFNLKELSSFIGYLNALQKLNLSKIFNLKELSSFIGYLNALQKLYLSKCCNLKELPSSINQLAFQISTYKTSTTCKNYERSKFIYRRIECTQSVSFVKVFQFEIISFIY